ncbi:MAG: hypothetical protein CML24_09635, partial [Rhizobiales bacterium]|nr:hypothetical protein [Hyphomicrobiales bacterium]
MHHDELVARHPHFGKSLGVERPGLDFAAPVPYPDQRRTGRRPQAEPGHKSCSSRDVERLGRVDFVHGAPRQTAPQGIIDRAGAQSEDAVPPGLAKRIETGQSLPQHTDLAGFVHGSMFLFCSIWTQIE